MDITEQHSLQCLMGLSSLNVPGSQQAVIAPLANSHFTFAMRFLWAALLQQSGHRPQHHGVELGSGAGTNLRNKRKVESGWIARDFDDMWETSPNDRRQQCDSDCGRANTVVKRKEQHRR